MKTQDQTHSRIVGGKLITEIVREIPDSPSAMNWREELRSKQDRIIDIATERKMPFDVSISEAQIGSPTVLQLHSQLWPDYLPSINSFLNTFDK